MPKCFEEPYSGNSLKFKQELYSSIDERPTLNKVYLHPKGFKWLENSHGYIHIWIKSKTRAVINDGYHDCYLITHYRVTKYGKLHELGYSPYANAEAANRDFDELQ